jgi:hypothetical protein
MTTDLQPSPVEANSAPEDTNVEAQALFFGDTGKLPEETRRVLVQLLTGPSIDGQRHPHQWTVLLRDEALIRSRLAELFLELIMDREQQVAFMRQVQSSERDIPILLRRKPLTFIETVLILHLRQRLTQADATGGRAVIAATEMLEHLALYEQADNVDQGKFSRQCDAAIEKVKKMGLLATLKGGEARYEVSPTLKLLFTAEHIQSLMDAYDLLRLGGSEPAAADDLAVALQANDVELAAADADDETDTAR